MLLNLGLKDKPLMDNKYFIHKTKMLFGRFKFSIHES